MDLIQLKQYLKKRRVVALRDLAVHFDTEPSAVEPMVERWVQKGKVKKHAGNLGCTKGCCACDPATIVSYEWLG
ncbi:FeoC-like transcriptional regulator [Desulfogranum mediterraneum]|uniref:FeoC-like transcriptional regulator n=1 Tax=Desulfogranum mediterraneum TaxID=160661 RepID=UPI000415E840|nr:FeoC-like transcriptional regulator [Desulfogranum mediterraneum]